jgi:superfamily II DNA or RNA helicase
VNVIPKVDNSGHKVEAGEIPKNELTKTFVVIIPYKDETLISNHGYNKMGRYNFMYECEVTDSLSEKAKEKAIEMFYGDSDMKSVLKSNEPKKKTLSIQESEILVFEKP